MRKLEVESFLLVKYIDVVLNSTKSLEYMRLINDVKRLKQLIPKIINSDKETYLDLFDMCQKKEYLINDDKDTLYYSVMRLVKEIDNKLKI